MFLPFKGRCALLAGVAALPAACGLPPVTTYSVYRTAGLTAAQWSAISKECKFEATKATATNTRGSAVISWHQIHRACAEAKGATFLFEVVMPQDKFEALERRCKAEAQAAVAGRPRTMQRDTDEEDFDNACTKREAGV